MTVILNDEAEILNGVEELLLVTDETTEAESTEDVQQMPEAVTIGEKTEAGNIVLPQTKTAVTNKKQWSRRLVIVTGDKGGVGKSTFARGLAQTYLDIQKEFLAFDADISNSHLSRFYGHQCLVRELDFFTEGNVDIFLDDLKQLIEDTGVGIEAEDLANIFLPFYRGAISSPGSGLGLYIAMMVAYSHGLKLSVNSVVGKGTIFTIKFPYQVNNSYGVDAKIPKKSRLTHALPVRH